MSKNNLGILNPSKKDANKLHRIMSVNRGKYPKGVLGLLAVGKDFNLMKDYVSDAPLHNKDVAQQRRKAASEAKRKKIKTSQQKKKESQDTRKRQASVKARSGAKGYV
jgi:hypothetical protein